MQNASTFIRGLRCLVGRAQMIIPSRAAHHVAFLEVTGPLPLAKPYVLGVAHWGDNPLVVFGFARAAEGRAMRRVVLLDDEARRSTRVGIVVDGVERLTNVSSLEGLLGAAGAAAFFRRGRDETGDEVRVLEAGRVIDHVLGPPS